MISITISITIDFYYNQCFFYDIDFVKLYYIMTTITNLANFRQYTSRLSLLKEQILEFSSSISLIRELENLSRNVLPYR